MVYEVKENVRGSSEQKFLLALCRSYADPLRYPAQEIRLPSEASWAAMLELAVKHRLLLLVADYILRQDIHHDAYPFSHRLLWEHVEVNRYRHACHVQIAREVQQTLRGAGIPSVLRKGVVYASLLYGERVLRAFGDIDMYVLPEHSDQATAVMDRLGFARGEPNHSYSGFAELGRPELIKYMLYPDHMPRFIKALDDRFVPTVSIDLSLDIAWTDSDANPVRHDWLRGVLQAVVPDASGIATLPTYLHFFDCAVHLYRDAFFEWRIRTGREVDLSKFLDLLLLWQRISSEDHLKLSRDVRDLGMASVLAWSLYHLDQVFGQSLLDQLELRGALRHPNGWQTSTGQIEAWKGTMTDRLFSRRRLELFGGLSAR